MSILRADVEVYGFVGFSGFVFGGSSAPFNALKILPDEMQFWLCARSRMVLGLLASRLACHVCSAACPRLFLIVLPFPVLGLRLVDPEGCASWPTAQEASNPDIGKACENEGAWKDALSIIVITSTPTLQ